MLWHEEHCFGEIAQVPLVAYDDNAIKVFWGASELEREQVTEVFTGLGEHGVKADNDSKHVIDAMREYLTANVPVGPYFVDQLLLPLGISAWQTHDDNKPRGGSFRTVPLSHHSVTHIDVIAGNSQTDTTTDPWPTSRHSCRHSCVDFDSDEVHRFNVVNSEEQEPSWFHRVSPCDFNWRSNQSANAVTSSVDLQKSPQPCPLPGRTINSACRALTSFARATKDSDCWSGTT